MNERQNIHDWIDDDFYHLCGDVIQLGIACTLASAIVVAMKNYYEELAKELWVIMRYQHGKKDSLIKAAALLKEKLTTAPTSGKRDLDGLREALEHIVKVASGESQVADDDTGGMEYIDKYARAALAAQRDPLDTPRGGGIIASASEETELRAALQKMARRWRNERAHTYASENADHYYGFDAGRLRSAEELETALGINQGRDNHGDRVDGYCQHCHKLIPDERPLAINPDALCRCAR